MKFEKTGLSFNWKKGIGEKKTYWGCENMKVKDYRNSMPWMEVISGGAEARQAVY